jgi:hypothetical protein
MATRPGPAAITAPAAAGRCVRTPPPSAPSDSGPRAPTEFAPFGNPFAPAANGMANVDPCVVSAADSAVVCLSLNAVVACERADTE